MRARGVLCLGLAVAAGATLAGCGALTSPIPEPSDLTCTWRGSDGSSIVQLGMYGELSYEDLPLDVVNYPDSHGAGTTSGDGTWSYGNGVELRSGGQPVITLRIEDEAWALLVVGAGDAIKLVPQFDGDPDSTIGDFVLVRESCP